jgi:hypothetical protein
MKQFKKGMCYFVASMMGASLVSVADVEAQQPSYLFVQNAHGMSFNDATETLTLGGISPVVTYFTDRPVRSAGHLLLSEFVELWDEGQDSFEQDPPNASLSIFSGESVTNVVVELADPTVVNGQVTYQVVRVLEGELPATGGVCSLFIDGLGTPGKGGAIGGVLGAAVGSISGNAGEGAAIGAGVGLVGGLFKKHSDDKQDAATTRVVDVQNANGSMTPVTLHLVAAGWQGPKGEIYPTLPSASQLAPVYGIQ